MLIVTQNLWQFQMTGGERTYQSMVVEATIK
jgi:hypothetical protein